MGTTRDDIRDWYREGLHQHATHLLVVTDTYDWEDYPVYAVDDADCTRLVAEYQGWSMQRVTEVYDLRQPLDPQLNAHRSWSVPR
jgi:hypothetical protein